MPTELKSASLPPDPALEVAIRKGRPDDAARIHELHLASVRSLCSTHYPATIIDPWPERRKPSGCLEPIARGVIFLAQLYDRVVGFGETAPGSIEAIFVDPEFARRGVGRALLQHALAQAQAGYEGPITLEATLNAREFCERFGSR
jgi:putative acetyltransferase